MLGTRFASSTGVVGIDLGSGSTKMLQLREQGDRFRVLGAARIDAPPLGRLQPEWGPSAEQLHAAFTSGGFTGRRCIVCLPRGDVRVQSVRLPRMTERELAQAAVWEASHRFEAEKDSLEVDYIATGAAVHGSEDRQETLIIAVPREAVQRRLEPVLEAGFRPVAVDTDFAALARAASWRCRRTSDRAEARAVLEIGASGASIMILRGDAIAFYKPIELRGVDLSRAVADHLQIDLPAAVELRVGRMGAAAGLAGAGPVDPATDRAVYEAVRPRLNDLVKEVVLCLRYYGVTFRGHPPTSILLTGGDGTEPNLDRLIHQACKIPVTVDDPRETFAGIAAQIRGLLSRPPGPPACWSVAAGLSLRGLLGRRAAGRREAA